MKEVFSLKNYNWKRTYKSSHNNLVKDFLIPALERSILYRRVAGYFSSSILSAAAAGIARLLNNDGEMHLITGADLSPQDVRAINQDPEKLNDFIRNNIPENLNDLNELERFITEKRFEALSWMLYKGKLKIKIALVLDENGKIAENQDISPIFHEKWGIFYDQHGNYLGFNGSVNESMKGWLENQERIDVYFSWDYSCEYIEDKINDFESYWNDNEPGIKVYDVSDAIEQKLIKYRKNEPPIKDPIETIKFSLKNFKEKSNDPFKISGIYNGLKFMDPNEFIFKQVMGFIDTAPGIQHNWNDLLNTISFKPMFHQEIIAYEIYRNYPYGYILCDEVGLGKTIEAGLVVKWLILAGRIKRVLIIIPKNLVKQWQEEMREKFNLEFFIYDGKYLINYWDEKYKAKTYNSYNAVDLILVSSGLVQLENRKIELLNSFDWDLIIFDEAHHLRRRHPTRKGGEGTPTRLLRLAQDLKKKTRCFLLLTATPIQMRIQELFDLLKLLRLGGKWGLKENFDKFYRIISQKIEDIDKKDWEFLIEMAKDYLQWGRINKDNYEEELLQFGGMFQSDFKNIFIKNYDFLPYLEEKFNNKNFLQEFKNELEVLSPLRWYMFRNTRNQLREYGIHIPVRKPKDETIVMKKNERQLYREIETYLRDIYKKSTPEQKSIIGFTLAIYRRRLTSSFYAIKKTLERRLNYLKYERDGKTEKLQKLFDEDDFDDDLIEEYEVNISEIDTELESSNDTIEGDDLIDILSLEKETKKKKKVLFLAKNTLTEEIEYLKGFIEKIDDFLERNQESKFERFISLLNEANLKNVKRVLVFTQYTDTLIFLRNKIKDNPNYEDIGCYSGKGGELLIKNKNTGNYEWQQKSKEEIKNWFFEESSFKILICTDAASEGLNFQICNWMINYDLPWNPMKVEQRIGRIDRVHQKANELYIFNLIYNETIEGRIYKKLWERIRLFQNTIGPLRPILNIYQKAEKFAIEEGDDALTEDEIEKMLRNIREETETAQYKHDFFIKLLKRRVLPEIETEKKEYAIIKQSDNFEWIKKYFSNIYNFQKTLEKSFKLIEQNEKRIILSLVQEKGLKFFNQSDRLTKRKAKNEKRALDKLPYNFSITCDPEFFTNYPSNYYFNFHCNFFSNFINYFLPHKEKFIPTVLKENDNQNNDLISALIITRIIFSKYPFINKEGYYLIEFNLQNWEIINIVSIINLSHLKESLSNITNNIKNKKEFIRKLNNIKIHADKIRNNMRILIKRSFMRDFKKFLKFCEDNELFNWYKIENSFNAIRESFKIEIETKIKEFLILEYLYDHKDDNWKFFPEVIYLENYCDSLEKIENWENINKFLIDLKIEIEKLRINSDSEIFTSLINKYKSKKQKKLLKADQGRLRNRILNMIKEFNEEIKIYNSRKMEYLKITKINEPQILICGMILK
ncbi:MAG: SNF2-related protein [Promethearchaeia archaeon]